VNASLTQWLDRAAIRLAGSRMPQPDGRDLHLEEAQRLLQHPDFFAPAIKPAALEFHGPLHFRFDSALPGAHATNNVVHGRFYKRAKDWRKRPAIILLHGWNDFLNHQFRFPGWGRQLNKMGVNVMTLQLPYHFDRRPRELGAWGNFLCADVFRTVGATAQALADIRSVIEWLLANHCPGVGLWGVSMGGWLAGLTLCHDSRIQAAVLTVPVARLDQLIAEVAFCDTIRSALQGRPVDLRKLNLTANTPMIDRSKILLIEAEYDLFVARETVEELWQAWERPEIWRLRHGHISVLAAPGLFKRAARWVSAKLLGRALK
jgi:dienelactone hydrolase